MFPLIARIVATKEAELPLRDWTHDKMRTSQMLCNDGYDEPIGGAQSENVKNVGGRGPS